MFAHLFSRFCIFDFLDFRFKCSLLQACCRLDHVSFPCLTILRLPGFHGCFSPLWPGTWVILHHSFFFYYSLWKKTADFLPLFCFFVSLSFRFKSFPKRQECNYVNNINKQWRATGFHLARAGVPRRRAKSAENEENQVNKSERRSVVPISQWWTDQRLSRTERATTE